MESRNEMGMEEESCLYDFGDLLSIYAQSLAKLCSLLLLATLIVSLHYAPILTEK